LYLTRYYYTFTAAIYKVVGNLMPKNSVRIKSVVFVCLISLISAISVVIFLSTIDTTAQQIINNNLIAILLFCVFLLPICFFISHFFIQRILQSFFGLSAFIRKVKETKDYSLRIKPSGGVELSAIGQNINDMLETLYAASELNRMNTRRLMESQVSMDRMARYDTLTGLPNRKYFMETLERVLAQSKRSGKDVALMFFDLDGFKLVNDTYGHKIGDALLIEAANRARGLLRQGDIIARLGGDEFLILLYNDPSEVTVNEIAKRLAAKLSLPYSIETWQLEVTASIGITVASDSGFDIKEFIGNADIAMYRSKNSGPGNYTVFAAHMKQEKKRRLDIANALSQALSKNEFHLVYQAKVDNKNKVVGYEALIRWNSQSLGFVPPDEFIQIAEQSGKISLITFWVLESLCKDMTVFINQHGQHIKLSFNLSALDLKDAQLSSKIELMLKQYAVDGRNIEIEVTESVYLDNFDSANAFFEDMTKLNCSIALDDFGTGYSSLGYLAQINIDTLKIDKQFVDHVTHSTKSKLVTKAIIEMGKQLGLEICAEGVETEEQATLLKDCGCHQLQGYLYSKPMPIEQLFAINNIQLSR
jgi:diguanylate cyclase (GGDEF)-like protein